MNNAPKTSAVPVAGITSTALAVALGTNRKGLLRAVEAGRLPEPDHLTPGNHRRWTSEAAAEIVRAAGRVVPTDWNGLQASGIKAEAGQGQ